MIRRIAVKEMTEMFRDGRFRWASALLLGLMLVALATGATNSRALAREHDAAQETMRGFWVNQGAKNPHSAAHYGLWVFKPKMPLSFVDYGVDNYTGVTTWLEAHKQNEFTRRPAMDQASVARFGEWTAAAVLQLLVPLLIVMLAFPAFAGERETGTLRQLIALGVPMRTLMMGKAIGLASALAAVLVPATILGVGTLAIGANFGRGTDDVLRFAAMIGAYLLYFTVVLVIALAVSARTTGVRIALLTLLAFWTVNSLVAPRAVADLARRAYPTPSSFAFQAGVQRDTERGLDGHNPADARRKAVEEQALREYRTISLDALPVNFDAIAMQASEEYANTVFDKHFGDLYDQYRAQNTLTQWSGLVSPLLAVRSLSMGLAGTDIEQHRDFAVQAELYRRGLIKWTNNYFRDNTRTGEWDWKAPPELWAKYQSFVYDAPGMSQTLRHQGAALSVLAIWLLVALGLLWSTPAPRVA
ncbi:ABC transporter permease [Gemmatimonas sp.]|uniref:ABC transporter permease n=1 Tax=Gemmatimonas sp. TaxID=1962908 RepID=UPI00356576C9